MYKFFILLIFIFSPMLKAQIPNEFESVWKGQISTYDGVDVLTGDFEIEIDEKKLQNELRFFISKFSPKNLENFSRLPFKVTNDGKNITFNHICPTDADLSTVNGEYNFTLKKYNGQTDYLEGIFKTDKNFGALIILFRKEDHKKMKSSNQLVNVIENIVMTMSDDPEEEKENATIITDEKKQTVSTNKKPKVYIVGQEEDQITKNMVAKIWIDGVVQNLTSGETNAGASSVFVVGEDIYVAGQESNSNGISIAKVWKNGIPQELTDGTFSAHATDVFVSNDELYVTINGYKNGKSNAMLWKNGSIKSLANTESYVWSVYVDYDKNIYVTGHEHTTSKTVTAKVWKNGVLQNLTTNGARANDIIVRNNDVYVVGFDNNKQNSVGALWKNGVSQNLTSFPSNISSIFIDDDNNVYVAGQERRERTVAKVWKNGTPQNLTDGKKLAFARSLFVNGNDVYVVGHDGETATLWKNGVAENLTDGKTYASANDIFVK